MKFAGKPALLLLIAALLLSACGAASRTGPSAEEDAPAVLELHFFDAGDADAILLTTENSAVLVDTGEKGFGKTILSYLREKGIEKLDYLIVTHFDKDHVGGAAKLLNSIPVGTVLQSNQPKDSEEYDNYVTALADAGIEPDTVRETASFRLDGVLYTVDPPRRTVYPEDSSNNSSLIVSVQNGDNRFLLPGDAKTLRLREFLDGNTTSYDVLKLPHHGREEPLLSELLASVRPSFAVICTSEENAENITAAETLTDSGIRVLVTGNGAVTLRSDGSSIRLEETEPAE